MRASQASSRPSVILAAHPHLRRTSDAVAYGGSRPLPGVPHGRRRTDGTRRSLPAASACLVRTGPRLLPAAPRTVARPRRGEQSVPRGDAAGTSPLPGRSGGMYARSTTLRGNPQAVDDLIATVRDEVMPMLMQLDGCVGVSMLADRDPGRCIATSAWETEEAMRASAERVRESRERAAARFGATPEVQEWEIAVLHRAHRIGDGACARVTWTRTDPTNLDEVIAAYRESLMPWWEETPGFCSNSLLVDRRDGRCASAVVFDNHDAMAHTRDQFTTLRDEFTQRMGMEILEVAEFDLALAHLRVPETV